MAGKETMSITFKLNGETRSFQLLAKDADGFRKVMSSTVQEAQKLNKRSINFAAFATGIDSLQSSVTQLYGTLKGLTDAYAVQEVAEKQLETVMRQRMNATDKEIQSIKDLASAQQALGVIGDEVQLSGAQQIATFLRQKSNLEVLIPAMNDLIAQQKGLNATNQDAVTVANLMGKAMMGQASALRRVGISFDESQEKVLKFGTESERAAMLAEIITDNVGHMNAQLAATDSGKQKQLENTLGDIKEQIGGMVKGAMPFITIAAQSTTAATGVMKLVIGLKATTAALTSFNVKGKIATLATLSLGLKARQTSALMHLFSTRTHLAAASVIRLKIAVRGLLMLTGVGVAITAVTAIISHFSDSSDEAAESVDHLKDAQDEYTTVAADVETEIGREVSKLKELIDGSKDTTLAVADLNEKYGQSFGTYRTAAEWYEVLTKKSSTYARQMGLEAKARILSNRLAEKQIELDSVTSKRQGVYNSVESAKKNRTYKAGRKESALIEQITEGTKEYNGLVEKTIQLEAETKELESQLASVRIESKKVAEEMAAGLETVNTQIKINEMNWQQVSDAISKTDKKLKNTTDPAAIKALRDYNDELNKRKTLLEKQLGLNKSEKPETDKKKDKVSEPPAKLENLKDYANAIAYYTELQQTASQEEYKRLQGIIDALAKERDAFTGVKKAALEDGEQYKSVAIEKLDTLQEMDGALAYYTKLQRMQSAEEAMNMQKTINAINEKKEAMLSLLDVPALETKTEELEGLSDGELEIKLKLIGEDEIRNTINKIKDLMDTAPAGQREELEKLAAKWTEFENIQRESTKSNTETQDALNATGQLMNSIGNIVGGVAGQWMQWGENVVQSIAQAIPAIASLIDMKKEEATANAASAATGAASSVASIPFAGPIMAVAAVASVLAALAGLPKFAKGGIAYGPTLGLFGEYSGAANNPEVVAPLDRLRSMIEPAGSISGEVEFKIKGRSLVGVLNKESSIIKRS